MAIDIGQSVNTGKCGTAIGWWSPYKLCDQYGGTTIHNITSFLNCNTLKKLYQCNAGFIACQRSDAINSNCCGCVDWWMADCIANKNITPLPVFTKTCGLKVAPPAPVDICHAFNQDWINAMFDFSLARRIAAPTAYVYPYDDKTGGNTCNSWSDVDETVKIYHVVACPENGNYKLKTIQPSNVLHHLVFSVLNNCNFPVWPALVPNSAIGKEDPPKVMCTIGNSAGCYPGKDCIRSNPTDPTVGQCYYNITHPWKLSQGAYKQVAADDYKLEQHEDLQFRIPIPTNLQPGDRYTNPADINIVWAGGLHFRTGCNSTNVMDLCVADCRPKIPALSTGFMCDPFISMYPPFTRVEGAFKDNFDKTKDLSDSYDIQAIDSIGNHGIAIFPDKAIPAGLDRE